jgi:hypothetical protein
MFCELYFRMYTVLKASYVQRYSRLIEARLPYALRP